MNKDDNTNIEHTRKRLIFRSWHRGTKEMDLLLGTFADKYLPGFDQDQLVQYENLLQINDPDLYNWMTGKEEPPANVRSDVFDLFCCHEFVPSSEE